MKTTFHSKLINPPFDDPVVFARIIHEGRGLLFDLGDIRRLDAGDINKTTDIFISHTHMDHFIGFDQFLRICLRRETPIRIFGPECIADCVEGKLKGYTWNLIQQYPIKIDVYSISYDGIMHSSFYAENSFNRVDRGTKAFDAQILKDSGFSVKAEIFDHLIPVVGYCIQEDYHLNINKVALAKLDLNPGKWISDFKRLYREHFCIDSGFDEGTSQLELEIEGRGYKFTDLLDIAVISKGQKICFITDISPTEQNIQKAIGFASEADLLYCEAYFLHEDYERAIQRHHLTARIAGEIARDAKVADLKVMHFSPKYSGSASEIINEAMTAFNS